MDINNNEQQQEPQQQQQRVNTGSVDRSMRVIPPPSDDAAQTRRVVHLLKRLDGLLFLKTHVRDKFDELIAGTDTPGVRLIQGSRYEVFVRASFKDSVAFDWVCSELLLLLQREEEGECDCECVCHCEKLLECKCGCKCYNSAGEIRDAILDYAVAQARRDPRIGGTSSSSSTDDDYSFDNFSLLVSYGSVAAQYPHIDLQHPNHQFGLIVTDRSPATLVFEPKYSVQTVADLRRAWPDLPDTLAAALADNNHTRALLGQFGDLLCPTVNQVAVAVPEQQQPEQPQNGKNKSLVATTGTLLSLPGSVIHAGPAAETGRALLFFTAWPRNSPTGVAQYHPDTQYFAPLLCSDMASVLWAELSVSDRVYLLTKLADTIKASNCKDLFRHLSDRKMIDFTRGLAWGKYKKGRRGNYIATFAAKQAQLDVITGFADEHSRPMEKVSVDTLVTEWDGELKDIEVYRRADKAVQIYYPADGTWEGGGGGDDQQQRYYSLTVDEGSKKTKQRGRRFLFDGSNGVLRDSDGDVIQCFASRRAAAAAAAKTRKRPRQTR